MPTRDMIPDGVSGVNTANLRYCGHDDMSVAKASEACQLKSRLVIYHDWCRPMLTPITIASTAVWAVIVAIAITAAFEVRGSEGFDALVALVSTAIWMPTIIGVGARTAWPIVALVLLVLILLFEVFAVSVFVIAEEHMADVQLGRSV